MRNLILTLACLAFATGCSVSSTANELERAINSGDQGAIVRAFHDAIYDRFRDTDEALVAVRHCLNHADPFVRFQAAKTLYTAGDRSGYSTLLAFVDSSEAQMDGKFDLRIEAARLLKKFREKEAAVPHLVRLYERTKDSVVLNAIARLLGEETPQSIKADLIAQKGSSFGLFNLIFAKAQEAEELAKAAFINPRVPEVYQVQTKQITAWYLARITKDTTYLDYLIQAAQPAITGRQPSGSDPNESRNALKYLGSLRDPRAKQILEDALESPRPSVVECAVVNLLFNQPGGSTKARQVVLRQLKGVPLVMESWERTLQIAAKLDDPEMRDAGEAFDRRSSGWSWDYWVKRNGWPVYNWIDDYVIALEPL